MLIILVVLVIMTLMLYYIGNLFLGYQEYVVGMLERVCEEDAKLVNHLDHP